MMRAPSKEPPVDLCLVVDELQRRDFLSFAIGAFPYLHGGVYLVPNWHLDAIAHELGLIHTGVNRRLLVTVPPRNLKSFLISVAFIAWSLGRDPRLNFVSVSYASELSKKYARDCRELMQTAWYKRLFPGTIIKASRRAVQDFETTRGGCRLATSVGGTLTGRGGDIIIVDDPTNPAEANSQIQRDSANDWFASTLGSRLNNKTTGAMIVVMQRLHQFDLAGMLLEKGGWKHFSLPAIAQVDEEVPLTRGRTWQRKAGDVLHPAYEPYESLMDTKRFQGSQYFNAQYLQDPVPADGDLVKAKWLQYYDTIDPALPGQIVQSADTALRDGEQNDYSVVITAFVSGAYVYIIDVFRRKLIYPDLKREVIRLAQHHKTKVLLIEDHASGMPLIDALKTEQPPDVPMPIPCRPTTDKISRMQGVTGQIEGGELLLPKDAPWLAEFKSEILGFPNTKYKDQADALTQLMEWTLRNRRRNVASVNAAPISFELDQFGNLISSDGANWDVDPDQEYLDPWGAR